MPDRNQHPLSQMEKWRFREVGPLAWAPMLGSGVAGNRLHPGLLPPHVVLNLSRDHPRQRNPKEQREHSASHHRGQSTLPGENRAGPARPEAEHGPQAAERSREEGPTLQPCLPRCWEESLLLLTLLFTSPLHYKTGCPGGPGSRL